MRSVFVSSTFRDMQFERDMLQTIVEPQLNATAVRYADSVFFSDLRWGISTEELDSETGSRKILSVCLDEIERCRPYMLIFIGERYGWIPDEQLIIRAAEEKGFSPLSSNISVTTLEIEFGALQEAGDLDRCIFCFREPLPFSEMTDENRAVYDAEDEEHRAKLQALKDRIRSTPGAKIIEYRAEWDRARQRVTGLEPLAEKLANELSAMFSPEWELRKNDDWQQTEKSRLAGFIENKSAGLYIRSDVHEEILRAMDESAGPLMLRGAPGSGKTTLACQLSEALAGNGNVCTVICGSSERMMDVSDILRYMIYSVEGVLGRAHADADGTLRSFSEYRQTFEALLDEYDQSRAERFAFIIDAVDQLSDAAETVFLMLPENEYRSIRFIFSMTDAYKIPAYVERRSGTIEVRPLDEAAKRAVIAASLRRERKEVASKVIDAMVSSPASDNPLFLSLLLRRLVMFNNEDFSEIASLGNDMDAITAHMLSIVESCPSDLDAMCCNIADEAGGRINKELSEMVMGLIAASRFGLRESDLKIIFENGPIPWNQLDFSRLAKYMGPFLIERTDGRFDYSHKSFREGLRNRDPERRAAYDEAIYKALKQLPPEDSVRQSEIIYHMYKVGDGNALTDTLVNCCAFGRSIERETRELRLLCIEFGPEWLISVIESDYSKAAGPYFYSFFSTVFCTDFRDTYLEQSCLLKILEAAEKAASGCGGFQSEEVRGTLEYQIACILEDTIEDKARAVSYYEKAYEHLKSSGSYKADLPIRVNLGIACHAIASYASDRSDFETAEKYLREANSLYSELGLLRDDDPDLLRCLAENELQWAKCCANANDLSGALEHLEKSLNVYERIPAPDPRQKEDFLQRAGRTRMRTCIMSGDYEAALDILRGQEAYRRAEYDRTRDVSVRRELEDTLMDLANVCSLTGRGSEAVMYAKEAEDHARLIDSEMKTAASARSLVNARYRAAGLIKDHDPALAAEFADRAVSGARDVLAEYDNNDSRENLALALRTRSEIAEEQQQWDLSLQTAEEAVSLFETVAAELGSENYDSKIMYVRMNILRVLLGKGRYEEAFAMLKDMLAKAREQMLSRPGTVSLSIYDNLIEMPFATGHGWDRPEYLDVLSAERTATIFMSHNDPMVLKMAESECRAACYEIQGLIQGYKGDMVMGIRDMRKAQDVYMKTFEACGHDFFKRKAERIEGMISISSS